MFEILRALTSPDNDVRRNAESQFDNALRTTPDQLVLELTAFCANISADKVLRSLAMILLRRILTRQSELWQEVLKQETRIQVRQGLLLLLDSPDMVDKSMRKKLCDSISIVALMTFHMDEEWPDLIATMFRSVTTPGVSSTNKENALNLFTNLSSSIREKLSKEFGMVANIVNNLASNNEPDLDVRIAAVRAAWCLVESCNQDTDGEVVTPFKVMVGTTLDVITAAILAHHPRSADPLEDLIDLAGSPHARLFSKKDIERTLQMMLELATLKQKNGKSTSYGNMRLLAIELIMALMETRGAAIRKIKPPENAAVQALLPILIQMTMELPDLKGAELQAWGSRYPAHACASSASQHDDDEDDCGADIEFEVFGAALDYIDRMTDSMKPKHVLPVIFARAAELIQQKDVDWKYPHSALLILAHVVEFTDRKEPQLAELCRTAAMFAVDHPYMRVRHAGFTLIARLAFDCAPDVHERHSMVLIQALLKGLADPVPRVQAHAAVALINYCSTCQDYELFDEALKPYLSGVVNCLFNTLQNSSQVVQMEVISALAAVARSANEDFRPFYASMPILKSAVMSLSSPTQFPLKARIIDCISVIGSSVGKEMFLQDALWLLQLLDQTPLVSDEVEMQHIQAAWMVLGQVLGEDIGPFLHRIVPFTLEMANKPIDMDEDDESDDLDEEQMKETMMELHKVRTAAVDDRLLALEMLCSFASHTKKAFFPFLEQTLAIFFRDARIENCVNDDVRGRVAAGFPDLIQCALSCVEAGQMTPAAFGQVLVQSLEVLCVGSNSEDLLENLKIMVRSMMDILTAVHGLVEKTNQDACPEYVEPCAAIMTQLFKDSVQRRALEFASLKCDTAEDEVDEEVQAEYEEKVNAEHELQFLITGVFGALIKTNPHSFVSSAFLSAHVGEEVFDIAHHVRLCHDQKIAVFILVDMMEFASKETIPSDLLKRVSDVMIRAVKVEKSTSPAEPNSRVAQLVQAAAYGLGIIGERFGDAWPQVDEATHALVDVVSKAPKDLRYADDSYGTCLDNCVSATMKIAKNCANSLRALGGNRQETMLEIYLNYMPLQGDVQESRLSSLILIQLLEENAAPFLVTPQVLPLVVRAFANIIGAEYLDDQHVDRAVALLERIREQIGQEVFNNAIRSVPQEQLVRLAERVAKKE